MNSQEFTHLLPNYLNSLQQQGKSWHTIQAYQRDLSQLSPLLPADGTLEKHHFTQALRKLSQQNHSPRSLARKLSSWRQYLQYLVQQGVIEHNPIAQLKAPKIPALLPKAVSAEPLNHTFNLAHKQQSTNLDKRDLAIFELLYGCGLRLSEVQQLNLSDIKAEYQWLSIIGKGGKERQVPIGQTAKQALLHYLSIRQAPSHEPALFVSQQGKRISTRQIQKRLNSWGILHQSTEHLHPHKLRHSYASHLLQSSGDIRAVQELLGHSSLSTTQIYTKLDFEHLAQSYDQAHPRAKRKK